MKIFGIMITYRRRAAVADFLARLAEQEPVLDHLLVVDNAADDAVSQLVTSHVGHPSSIDYVAMPENLGPAGGIAAGMSAIMTAAGPDDWMVLLDDDDPPWSTTILSDLRDFAVARARDEPSTGAVALDGARWDPRRARLWRPPTTGVAEALEVDYLTGDGFPFYRVKAVKDVGPPDERLFFGFDDLEIGLRLRRSGYRLFLHGELYRERQSLAGAAGNATADAAAKRSRIPPPWRRYYAVRNLLYLARLSGGLPSGIRVTMLYGLASPVFAVMRRERRSGQRLRLSLRACVDGWLARLGRRVSPDP